MTAKGKSVTASCVSVLIKEREIYEAISANTKLPKTCMITTWSPTKIVNAKNYFELVDEISEMGIPIETVYECIPKSVAASAGHGGSTQIIIASLKRGSSLRKKMIDFLYKCCSNNEYISRKRLREELGTPNSLTDDEIKTHFNKYACTQLLKIRANPKPFASHQPPQKVVFEQHPLKIECDTIYRKILLRMVEAGYGDTEYAAFAHVMKWAVERLDAEQAKP